MAEEGINGSIGPSLDGARLVLLSNSTKQRTTELHVLDEHISQHGKEDGGYYFSVEAF